MPAKLVKIGTRFLEVKSILLPSGNLLIPSRTEADRRMVEWREVEPGTSDHKRWLPVAVEEPDPRIPKPKRTRKAR